MPAKVVHPLLRFDLGMKEAGKRDRPETRRLWEHVEPIDACLEADDHRYRPEALLDEILANRTHDRAHRPRTEESRPPLSTFDGFDDDPYRHGLRLRRKAEEPRDGGSERVGCAAHARLPIGDHGGTAAMQPSRRVRDLLVG